MLLKTIQHTAILICALLGTSACSNIDIDSDRYHIRTADIPDVKGRKHACKKEIGLIRIKSALTDEPTILRVGKNEVCMRMVGNLPGDLRLSREGGVTLGYHWSTAF